MSRRNIYDEFGDSNIVMDTIRITPLRNYYGEVRIAKLIGGQHVIWLEDMRGGTAFYITEKLYKLIATQLTEQKDTDNA